VEQNNLPKAVLWSEMRSFCAYWNEKTQDGRRKRWEMQKTFEISLRLNTWFRNNKFKDFQAKIDINKNKGKEIII